VKDFRALFVGAYTNFVLLLIKRYMEQTNSRPLAVSIIIINVSCSAETVGDVPTSATDKSRQHKAIIIFFVSVTFFIRSFSMLKDAI
jgi:hypothetical protein